MFIVDSLLVTCLSQPLGSKTLRTFLCFCFRLFTAVFRWPVLATWQTHKYYFSSGHRRGLLLLDLTRALFLLPLGPHSRIFGLFLCVSSFCTIAGTLDLP